jgi:hypothetical protein
MRHLTERNAMTPKQRVDAMIDLRREYYILASAKIDAECRRLATALGKQHPDVKAHRQIAEEAARRHVKALNEAIDDKLEIVEAGKPIAILADADGIIRINGV